MARRPKLSRKALLNYVFHPRTAPKPLGIRKSLVTSTKWKTSRKNSWNAMSVADQQAIIASGKQNDYLTGKITLAESRRILRPEAIQQRVARPTRASINKQVAAHILSLTSNRPDKLYRSAPNVKTISKNVAKMGVREKQIAMGLSSYEELVSEATDANNIDEDGINPFWYH